MANRESFSSGAGMAPLDLVKDEDGTVNVLPVFSGVTLSKAEARAVAKWLISAYEQPEAEADPDAAPEGES